jgi:hypothetical protein
MRDAIQHYSSMISRILPRHELDRLKDDNFHFNPVVTEYVRHYYLTLRQYVRDVLVPDTQRFYQLALFLSRIVKEKWVINFLERDLFLRAREADNQIETIRRYLSQQGLGAGTFGSEGDDIFIKNILEIYKNIDQLFQNPPRFFTRNIEKLFYKTRTTFFTVVMETGEETERGVGKLSHLSTVIHRQFQNLTRKSGGIQVSVRQIASALHRISQARDHYYLLAYIPAGRHQVGTIDIRIADPRLEVVYDDNQRRDYISAYLNRNRVESAGIRLHNFQFVGGKLKFSLDGFDGSEKSPLKGRFEVSIMIKTTRNETVFNQSKIVAARQEIVDISLDFNWLDAGEYFLVLEARDLVSRKQDTLFSEIRVD